MTTDYNLSSAKFMQEPAGPDFVSLETLAGEIQKAFDVGFVYGSYLGFAEFAYDAGSMFRWFGEFRGTVPMPVYVESLVEAATQGYLDGGERGLSSPRLDFVPKLTDETKTAHHGLMKQISVAYVEGFDIARKSYKAAGIDNRASAGGGGMMAAEGNWGEWFLGTAALAAVVVAGVVLFKKAREGK